MIKTAGRDFDSAIGFYQRALSVTASHDALVALGDLYSLHGRHDEAQKQYDRLVAFHTSGDMHTHGGSAHVHPPDLGNAQLARFYADHDRNLDEALREAEAAFRAYKNVYVADTLAWCYYKKGRYDDALRTIAKALKWKTPDANILFHSGMIHEKAGDLGAAKRFLYRALSLNPHFHPLNATIAANTLKNLSEPSTPSTGEEGAEARPVEFRPEDRSK
jgi:tetratricopeptide (TPR) repeat protein